MREAIFIAASSWNSSFAAYGMKTWATWFLFLQGLHSKFCLVKFLYANELAIVLCEVSGGNLRDGCHKPTNLANMDPEGIGDFEQTLLQEGRGTMGNHTITFHFSET